jgi:cobalamin biosynthesis protein CobT
VTPSDAPDVALDGSTVYVTLPLCLVREHGDWCALESLDGRIIATLPKTAKIPQAVLDAVEKAERESREPVVFDSDDGRGRA